MIVSQMPERRHMNMVVWKWEADRRAPCARTDLRVYGKIEALRSVGLVGAPRRPFLSGEGRATRL